IDNLPSEINYHFTELSNKEREIDDLTRRIERRKKRLLSVTLLSVNVFSFEEDIITEFEDEEMLKEKISKDLDRIALLQDEKIEISGKALALANNLCNKVLKKSSVSGGCINSAFKLSTDSGDFFVKTNNSLDYDTLVMFKGEMVALNTISSSVPDFAPKALHAGSFKDGGAFLVTTFINLKSSSSSKHDVLFAKKLALLHSTNSPDNRFGFPVVTMCGATEQDNTWESDWETFYKERRLKFIIDKCLKKYPSNKELKELGKVVVDKVVHHLLKDIEVKSSLIHGDLWSGNWGIDSDTNEPVIYDPAAYYAHNEMELSILTMFGSPSKEFFDEYHKHHPRQKPFFKERQGI
ncbi:11559_t:CDS:2, partial [Entrophospora sp. SA101]